ncbi:MAG: c-type cytochrome [Magnetococcales bacterium]|nr:c-type cytochrome [Magnetococcales bacterium]
MAGCNSHSGAAIAADKSPSVAMTAKKVQKGKAVFVENCVACHQADAIGQPGVAPSLSNPEFLSMASSEFLTKTIASGRAGTSMVAFGEILSKQDINNVVAYIRSQATLPFRGEQIDAQPDAHGDERLGKMWFADICSTCHGVNGNGYESGGTGTAIGKAGFLNTVSDGFIRETVRHGRSNTRMRGLQGPSGLANLTDREIDDIITYMRTVPSKDEE